MNLTTKKRRTLSYSKIARNILKGFTTTVVFIKKDGILIRQPIRPAFIKHRNIGQLTDDLHAIKHDLKAIDYTI